MKTTLTALVMMILLAGTVFAAGDSSSAGAIDKEFAKLKAEKLKKLDDKITLLQARRACIQAANDQRAYEACNEKYKSAN